MLNSTVLHKMERQGTARLGLWTRFEDKKEALPTGAPQVMAAKKGPTPLCYDIGDMTLCRDGYNDALYLG